MAKMPVYRVSPNSVAECRSGDDQSSCKHIEKCHRPSRETISRYCSLWYGLALKPSSNFNSMRALRDNDGRWDGMHVTTIGCPTHPRSEEEAEERNAWTNVLDYRKCH